MARIGLIASKTLAHGGVVYSAGQVITLEEDQAKLLENMGLGEFIIESDIPSQLALDGETASDSDITQDGSEDDVLNLMKVPELEEYAKEAGVNLTGISKKDDIIAAIKAAEQAE